MISISMRAAIQHLVDAPTRYAVWLQLGQSNECVPRPRRLPLTGSRTGLPRQSPEENVDLEMLVERLALEECRLERVSCALMASGRTWSSISRH
jgi:hypothetical protein